MQDILEKASHIKLVIFDVDGVLTDGSLYIDANGRELKVFHSRDGHGMKMLQNSGVDIAVITARTSEAVVHRMTSLNVKHVYQGQQDKLAAFSALLDKVGLGPHQVAYVGDDVIDLPVMLRVGLAIAVQDAHLLVKKHAHWQTPNPGGRGAARDVCELIMEAQGTLEGQLGRYLAVEGK
ncbi:MAG: 3-deoxy-manno-octulosonate-8-phosphatase KdsC [Gammaproteobacteria bacterium]|nr:3-deoxy-manno-octulosonate-8-phosphatase KdsC [Gammaproteobacteria bacterium]